MEKRKSIFLIVFPVVFFSVCLFVLGQRIDPAGFSEFVKRGGVFGPIVYVALLSSTYIIAPLSGTPVFLAGYPLFGRKMIFLVYLATFFSSVINFWIARIWGRGLVRKLVGVKNIDKIDRFTQNYGVKSLIFFRVFQGYLFDFVSYAYGLTSMKFLPYLIVCALGPIPWLALWHFFFIERVESFADFTIWFVISLIPFYFVSLFLLAKVRKK